MLSTISAIVSSRCSSSSFTARNLGQFAEHPRVAALRELFIGIEEPENFPHPRLLPELSEFVEAGALMGHLWMEGHLGVGDPLTNAGALATEKQSLAQLSSVSRGPEGNGYLTAGLGDYV